MNRGIHQRIRGWFGNPFVWGEFEESHKSVTQKNKGGIGISKDVLKNLNIIVGSMYDGARSDSVNSSDDDFDLAATVFHRLVLRHAMLKELEREENDYKASKDISDIYKGKRAGFINKFIKFSDKSGDDNQTHPSIRSYRLATTDLFVEKAIHHLEEDYKKYMSHGKNSFRIGLLAISIGIICSFTQLFPSAFDFMSNTTCKLVNFIIVWECKSYNFPVILQFNRNEWFELASSFIKGVTFYGFLVLLTVGSWRYGKAMMDQAERLHERRHALRQGRLFVHLNDGILTIEQLEKSFSWNITRGNAFGDIQTEASAPWGGIIKEIARAIPGALKAFGTKKES